MINLETSASANVARTENYCHSRSRKGHAPEDSFLVDMESLFERHLVLSGIGLGTVLDELKVELAGEVIIVGDDNVTLVMVGAVVVGHPGS
jgi:hypothetical protein